MAQVLVLYPHPSDPAAFDRHYFDVHSKLALKIPQLQGLRVSRGPITSPQGACPYHLIAQLSFGSFDELERGLGSEESRIATEDLKNFAPDDRQVYLFDTLDLK